MTYYFHDTAAVWHLNDGPLDLSLPDGAAVVILAVVHADHLGRLPALVPRRVAVKQFPVGVRPLIQCGYLVRRAREDVPTKSMLIRVETKAAPIQPPVVVHAQCPRLLILIHAVPDVLPQMGDVHRHGLDLDAQRVAVTTQLPGRIHRESALPVTPVHRATLSATPFVEAEVNLVVSAVPAASPEVDALPVGLGFPVTLWVRDFFRTAERLPRILVPPTAAAALAVRYRSRPARTGFGYGRAIWSMVQLDARARPLAEVRPRLVRLAAVVGGPAHFADFVRPCSCGDPRSGRSRPAPPRPWHSPQSWNRIPQCWCWEVATCKSLCLGHRRRGSRVSGTCPVPSNEF